MITNYASMAIDSVLTGNLSFGKFLSENDVGKTGSNQAGILVPKSASDILFSEEQINQDSNCKRIIKITWQDDLVTESAFTRYASKNGELRITRFGRNFPFLVPDYCGSLFILIKNSEDDYSAFVFNTDDEINDFRNAFGISPTKKYFLLNKEEPEAEIIANEAILKYIGSLSGKFPSTMEMSAAARQIQGKAYDHDEYILSNPDQKIIDWADMEYELFKSLEQISYMDQIRAGFSSMEEFVKLANTVLNKRKNRAGLSLEHHLAAIFDGNNIAYAAQSVTEGNKKPDFLFPSASAYKDPVWPSDKLIMLESKTTCKDRWRQILNKADRLRDSTKYLFTLQRGISVAQMDEMQAENVVLVVPKPYIPDYPECRQDRIWTLSKFVGFVKTVEGR